MAVAVAGRAGRGGGPGGPGRGALENLPARGFRHTRPGGDVEYDVDGVGAVFVRLAPSARSTVTLTGGFRR